MNTTSHKRNLDGTLIRHSWRKSVQIDEKCIKGFFLHRHPATGFHEPLLLLDDIYDRPGAPIMHLTTPDTYHPSPMTSISRKTRPVARRRRKPDQSVSGQIPFRGSVERTIDQRLPSSRKKEVWWCYSAGCTRNHPSVPPLHSLHHHHHHHHQMSTRGSWTTNDVCAWQLAGGGGEMDDDWLEKKHLNIRLQMWEYHM